MDFYLFQMILTLISVANENIKDLYHPQQAWEPVGMHGSLMGKIKYNDLR